MRRDKPRPARTARSAPEFHHHPFRGLAALKTRQRPVPRPQAVAAPPATAAPREGDLFEREMAGVHPLVPHAARVPLPPPAQPARPVVDPAAEALAELSDLVEGTGAFDITDTSEYIEGAAAGLDPRLVRRLRAGEFSYQSHLDLHGMSADEARIAVDRFLAAARQRGQRCVLIIHGRGLNSQGQLPVLKKRLCTWLARGTWGRFVLAFTSARPCDGGAGALYVLLRRRAHARRPILVTEGAKR